ncbi:hypothetical protein HZA33_01590 [Candidatus Pacearchaeota archaeon]|nr:hypothetical protein [Candidatus Pacearchaeota archaeon]
MKKVSIIVYHLSKVNSGQKTAIQRALNGYIDHSNNQSYTYKRKGVLEQIPCKSINKGVVLVESKDKMKVISILRKRRASIEVINLYAKGSLLH